MIALMLVSSFRSWGQNCTTQAKLSSEQRTSIGGAAFDLASAVLAGDSNRVKASTIPQLAADFTQTAYLIRTTAQRIAGDSLAVTQVYLLDGTGRQASDSSIADFSCPLTGTVSETNFAIPGLPPGRYAFVMVEAGEPSPWVLAFLLQQESSGWKMAGFYPRARTASGHDGLWYWTTARADAKTGKPWLGWVFYSEADQLLRPAGFVTSGNLEKLRTEQRVAAPPPVANGVTAESPLDLPGPNGAQFRLTGLMPQASDDGKQLNLVMHMQADSVADVDATSKRSLAAAAALLGVHPELRQGFDNFWVVADAPGSNSFVVERPMTAIAVQR